MNSPNRPPIPEVNSVPLPAQDAPRPALLNTIAAILALTTPLGLWVLNPSLDHAPNLGTAPANPSATSPEFLFGPGLIGAVLVISLLITYFFWRGKNWARILAMIGSALSIFNIFSLSQYPSPLSKAYLILDIAFCAYLFFWLSRAPVAAYFKSPKSPKNPPRA